MIEFIPDIKDSVVIYRAEENGRQTGRITLVLNKTAAAVRLIEATDAQTAEGLIRSALNAAANRGGYTCAYEAADFADVAKSLGFKAEGDRLIGEIPFLLAGHCGCHN